MARPFIMPKLGLTMEEGTIAEWLIGNGDEVASGDIVLRISTDKTETDIEATFEGRLHTVGDIGETFACGETIAWLLDDGEEPPAAAPAPQAAGAASAAATAAAGATLAQASGGAAPVTAGGRIVASPLARRLAAERGIDLAMVQGSGPGRRIVSADLDGISTTHGSQTAQSVQTGQALPAAPAGLTQHGGGSPQPLSTFAARSLADLLGVDISSVAPDPRTNKVTKELVAAHVRSLLSGPAAPSSPASTGTSTTSASLLPALQSPSSVRPLTGMRGTIATRMHGSLQQMAQLSLFMDADLDAVVADRAERKAAGAAPGYTDYVIAAAARALQEHPHVNAQVTDDGIALLPEVHVGMAVALDDGLIVPVVRDTAGRDLADLAAETSRLAEAARSGSLTLPDIEGGTFSVSTLGMFGVDGFTPIINPPNAAILGVGRLRDDLVLGDDGTVRAVPRLTLSLTWDHRVFDGAPAAAFTQRIVSLLADPALLD